MRRRRWLGGALLVGLALLVFMFAEARRMPVIRTTTIALPGYPADAKPLRIALLTDTHMAGPDQSPERLRRIVAAIDARHPDIILLGGDYMSEPKPIGRAYGPDAAVAPLAALHAPLGVVAVLGNHDHWDADGTIQPALARIGITLLSNQAVRRGPLVIGGIDDGYSGHMDVPATLTAAARLGGPTLFLSHEPNALAKLPRGATLLTGHTHCGQIALPLIGPIWIPGKHRLHYSCGRYDERGKIVIVSGGVGTSDVPLRFWAPPDWWLITITGVRRS
ncbi:MAG TPA: metallophosphoesterase [Allosphingosinicella sp.]|nr:metallophosphoesterase [Allosphingosinicella sp.]